MKKPAMRMNYMGITPSQMSLFLLSKDMLYNSHFKTTRVVHQEAGKLCQFQFIPSSFSERTSIFESRVFETLTRIATCSVTV
jgi:hypothetical protein